nr:hypothetical protein [Saprospiraceae bacterium]
MKKSNFLFFMMLFNLICLIASCKSEDHQEKSTTKTKQESKSKKAPISPNEILAFYNSQPTAQKDKINIVPESLELNITMANSALLSLLGENGRFIYLTNSQFTLSDTVSYNILRHSGSLYAMIDYELKYGAGKNANDLLRGLDYLKTCCVHEAEMGALAVWSLSGKESGISEDQVKLGGTGLGLLALLYGEKLRPGYTSKHVLYSLGDFILYMQKKEGGFYSKYFPDERARYDKWTSLYYPGEAALALIELYKYSGKTRYLDGAHKALTFLANKRLNQRNVEADHWALLATKEIFTLQSKEHGRNQKDFELLLGHAIQICHSIIQQLGKNSFAAGTSVTPIATRLEGVQAALLILPKEEKYSGFRNELQEYVDDGINFLINAQIKNGSSKGAFCKKSG